MLGGGGVGMLATSIGSNQTAQESYAGRICHKAGFYPEIK